MAVDLGFNSKSGEREKGDFIGKKDMAEYITPAERDAVHPARKSTTHTVRQRRHKDGNKTVIYVEYRKES